MPEYLTLEQNYLDNLQRQARQRGLDRFPIVDCDSHYMVTPWAEAARYMEEPWRRRIEEAWTKLPVTFIPNDPGDRTMAGRLKSYTRYQEFLAPPDSPLHPQVYPILDFNKKAGIDYTIQFPTDMLVLGRHPDPDWEANLAFAYARWVTDAVLSKSNTIKTMLYMPMGDPHACVELVQRYADAAGVVGFLVTSCRRHPIHDPAYLPMFELLERKGMPLGFHTVSHWQDGPFLQLNRFLASHALGFPLYNMVQMANILVNGIPERFPKLKLIFIEAGMAWLAFMTMRLDAEYMNRAGDAPLLRHKPSHYIKQFYYTTQPMEWPEDMRNLEMCMRIVGPSQILYASDYPHHDFDPPATVYDLPFLSEQEKRDILGGNALRIFGDLLTRDNVPGRDW